MAQSQTLVKASGLTFTDDISAVKKEIIALCTTLGGTKNEELMATLKEFTTSGNPNSIKNIDDAKKCLNAISRVKPIA